MKQIYRFDSVQPPALSVKTLQDELERRKLQRQTAILALAGILINWCLIITAIIILPVSAYLSHACLAYACAAMCGGTVIAIVFTYRRNLICQSH